MFLEKSLGKLYDQPPQTKVSERNLSKIAIYYSHESVHQSRYRHARCDLPTNIEHSTNGNTGHLGDADHPPCKI